LYLNSIEKVYYKDINEFMSIAKTKVNRKVVYENMTMEELGAKLEKSLNSNLTGKGLVFAKYSVQYNIDPYMAVAISLHETGCKWSCSTLVKRCNNIGGQKGNPGCMGSYQGFSTLDEGIEGFFINLKRNYIDYGLTTPEAINPKYAENKEWHVNIRKYIINILREYIKNTKEKKIEYDPLKKIIQKFYKKSRIEESKSTINKILDYTGKTISDEAFETLQLFLFISVIRNKNGHEIEEDVENEIFLSKTMEFSKIREILEKIENIKEKDIHYFVDFFLGSYSYNLEYSYFLNWILIESLIDQFIKLLSDKLKVNLTEDKILRKELLNHIKPAIYRMKNKFKLTESILSEVKKQYMELFIKTKSSLKIISDFIDLSFDEDEAAFITVMIQRAIMRNNPSTLLKKDPNILIVCGLGYSSSRFLYENINNRFQVNIIDIIPFNQLENYNYLKKADIIISTLDFKLDGMDVITVNAVMNEKDILKLKNYGLPEKKSKIKLSELLSIIRKVSDETELKKQLMRNFGENIYDDMGEKSETGKSFVELLSEKSIKLNVAANNLDEVIEITGQTMIDSGLVKEEYTDELKNQIIQYGKYILVGDKTILPHGQLLKNVRETGFSLITLKKGIDFFGSEIKIVICLASRNKDEHLRAILELNRYLKNPDFENELLNKENSEELTGYLKFLEMADI